MKKGKKRKDLTNWILIILAILLSAFLVYKSITGFATNFICTDSDGGKNYYFPGTVRLGVSSLTDSCINSSNLKEVYCSSDTTGSTVNYLCPDGCKDGACQNSSSIVTHSITENTPSAIQDIIDYPAVTSSAPIPNSGEQILDFKYLVKNGNFEDKLDILFIPFNITNTTFHTAMQGMLYSKGIIEDNICGNVKSRGLFETEPFKSNIQRFNIEFSEKELNFNFFYCYYGSSTPGMGYKPPLWCDWNKLKQNIPFEPDIIIIVGKDFSVHAGRHLILMGDPKSASVNPEAAYEDSFVHEFAHAFGGLTDEYAAPFSYNCDGEECYYVFPPDPCVDSEDPNCFSNTEKNIEIIPNEDTLGCPSWCKSYNRTLLLMASEECTTINNMKECLGGGGSCIWFKQKHPWFNANCIPAQLSFEDVGINCGTLSCVFSRHYSHIGFSPACKNGGMMLNMIGDFNLPSSEHISAALECCFPKNNSNKCKEFSEKFSNLPQDVNYYLGGAYEQFAQCSNLSSCIPNCTGKVCGDDGCGGSCGVCAGLKKCISGKCLCVPSEQACTSDSDCCSKLTCQGLSYPSCVNTTHCPPFPGKCKTPVSTCKPTGYYVGWFNAKLCCSHRVNFWGRCK